MKPGFSIRYKILTMVTALLVASIVFYLLLATTIFRQDKLELVFDLNKSVVVTTAGEVDTTLRGASDKLKLFALISGSHSKGADAANFKTLLDNDPNIAHLELYEQNKDGGFALLNELSESLFTKTYELDKDFFGSQLKSQRPIPFRDIISKSFKVWNATVPDGPALLGVGLPVVRETSTGIPDRVLVVVGYVKADPFLRNLKTTSLNQVYIVDSEGKTLIHPRSEYMTHQVDLSASEIVRELRENPVPVGVKEVQEGGRSYLGAFAHVSSGNLAVISQVESEKAFVAAKSLIRRSLLYALMISTITFIATVLFSRTLTRPLRRLMAAMQRVSDGKLDTEIQVKSHDEIAVLARSFNKMTLDLKSSRKELEQINQELENKVAERTKKLEEQNHAVKEAQEALLRTTRLASVGEIAGRTAHEVLNPLTSLMARIQKVQNRLNEEIVANKKVLDDIIDAWKKDLDTKGFQGLMKGLQEPSPLNPKVNLLQEDLGNFGEILDTWDKDLDTLGKDTTFLMQQALRIEKILKQMRSLTVVSSNRSRLKIQPLIHDAVNIVADLFAKNKVSIKEIYEASIDEAQVDRDELIQVLTNMLRNSLQAVMENKIPGKFVELRTTNTNDKLIIDIIDNGVGISEEHRPKLFESQFSTKSPDEGTGLGLSISRRFIRAFNGDLFLLKSSVKEGTTFRIELPLSAEQAQGVAA